MLKLLSLSGGPPLYSSLLALLEKCSLKSPPPPALPHPLGATARRDQEDLRSQGFDPSAMGGDEVFFRDANQMTYVPLTPDLHRKITAGMMRL